MDRLGVVEVSTLPSKPILAHEHGGCSAAHLCNLERPEAFNRILLTLLDSLQFQREQGLWESGPSLAVIGDVSMTPMLSRPGRARP